MPYTCIFCRYPSTRNQDLCNPCFHDLPILTEYCINCAAKTPGSHGYSCGNCLINPPPFNTTHALFAYQNPIKRLILNLKFQQSLVNARILGELFTEKALAEWYLQRPLPEVIIPMPLHPKRLRERGFNQALEIAKPISKTLGIPIDKYACQRIKHTAPQATLHADKRRKNIQHAFAVKPHLPYRHIAIVDDVITTGETTRELANTFRISGINHIDIWCCARALAH